MARSVEQLVAEQTFLLQATGRKPPRKRKGKVPPVRPSALAATAYLADIIRQALEPARQLVEERVFAAVRALVQDAVRADAPEDFARVIEAVRLEYARIVDRDTLKEVARGAAANTYKTNRAAAARQFKAILGLDILGADPNLADLTEAFVADNVGLIKTISSRYFDEIEQLVLRQRRAGVRSTAIIQEIQERYDVSRSRAKLIARDQTNKLNGQTTKARQEQLGIEGYIWRTSKDERVRSEHAAREGNFYRWDDPPEGGHPGEPIQCRCTAEPVIPGITD